MWVIQLHEGTNCMPVSDGFKTYIAELLAPLGTVSIKRMFGGAGVTTDGVTFAILASDVLYFKVDDASRQKYASENMGPFTYTSKSGEHALVSYWRCPERLMDEPDELRDWAREAIGAARRAAATPKPKTKSNPVEARKGSAKPKRTIDKTR